MRTVRVNGPSNITVKVVNIVQFQKSTEPYFGAGIFQRKMVHQDAPTDKCNPNINGKTILLTP